MKPKLPLTITALAITLLATYTAYTTLRLDLTFTNAKTEVSFWGRGNYQPTDKTRAKTGAQVDTLLAKAPTNPEYLRLAANRAAWEAFWVEEPDRRQALRELAMWQQHWALQARPAHRQSWQKLVEYASRAPGGEPLLAEARHRLQGLKH
jgi:hypothetical protein